MSEDEPIPSQRVSEKKKSEFEPVNELPIEENGKRVMPYLLQHQMQTWVRYGEKLLSDGRFSTLFLAGKKALCVTTNDQEKVVAFQAAAQAIDKERLDKARAAAAEPQNEGAS